MAKTTPAPAETPASETTASAPVLRIPDHLLSAFACVQNVRVEITAVRRRAALAVEALKSMIDDPAAAAALSAKGINAAEVLRTLRHAAAEPVLNATELPSDHG